MWLKSVSKRDIINEKAVTSFKMRMEKHMKILSIGNSFSEDAHVYLNALAGQREIDLQTVNVAIGGCSLQMHWDNIVKGNVSYLLGINGGEDWEKDLVSIEQILKSEPFDAITLQQVSGYSGQYETYQPYLNHIISFIRKHQPNARLYIHRTWAYEIDSTHSDFSKYDCNQEKCTNQYAESQSR